MLTRTRQHKQADRISESQAFHRAFTARCFFKTNEEIEICPTYKHTQPLTSISCDARRTFFGVYFVFSISIRSNAVLLSLRPFYFAQPAASGEYSWSMELLAFATRQFAPKTMDLSVRFTHIFVLFFFVSERSGRRKPPAERST